MPGSIKKFVATTISAFLLSASAFSLAGCSDAAELIDLALNPPERKPIDKSRVGVNNFFVNREFGSISEQFLEIRDTLGLKYVRVLFAFSDDVAPTAGSSPNYGFYDAIVAAIPAGIDVVVVLAHAPNWFNSPANWTSGGNPRATYVDRWIAPTVQRYAGTPGIIGYEIWNEPQLLVLPGDGALGLSEPGNYFDLVTYASPAMRAADPTKLVIMAATQSINQNFPINFNYNKDLRDFGIQSFIDVYNVHWYGESWERLISSGNIGDFLNGLSTLLWITESGEMGVNNQLSYVETAWPFLREEVPGIDRIYYYDYGSTDPADVTFSLKTTDPSAPVSDLYIHFRDGTR